MLVTKVSRFKEVITAAELGLLLFIKMVKPNCTIKLEEQVMGQELRVQGKELRRF
jgi:hypothetical protein